MAPEAAAAVDVDVVATGGLDLGMGEMIEGRGCCCCSGIGVVR